MGQDFGRIQLPAAPGLQLWWLWVFDLLELQPSSLTVPSSLKLVEAALVTSFEGPFCFISSVSSLQNVSAWIDKFP